VRDQGSNDVPEAVRRLIDEKLDSVVELEAILLLREFRLRAWSAREASERLYIRETTASQVLATLAERGFLTCRDETYRYEPDNALLEDACTALAAAYSRSLITVTRLIHSKPSSAARQFAEAFRLRKDK
jgi:DNA-binding IclR family transcriptional regulator